MNNDIFEDELFGLTKMDVLQNCLCNPFPGTSKWKSDNPIWDCNIYNKPSPKTAWNDEKYLMKAIDNLWKITKKSMNEKKYEYFVDKIRQAFFERGKMLSEVVLERFTIAKIAPKVTALKPTNFEMIVEESGIDVSNGIYCPMAGFGGIVEGAKRYFKKHGIKAEIEAYDINENFCNYYGWVKRDVLSQKIKTDKIVFVCPPFGPNTERWLGTPDNMYYEFEEWVKLIKEYIEAPNYIFVGPETIKQKNTKCGLFSKKYGIMYYPEFSNKK